VAVDGGIAFVADYDQGLQVIDVNPPDSAYIIGSIGTPSEAHCVEASGGYAYVTDDTFGLRIIKL
jgi:hypothetical protein